MKHSALFGANSVFVEELYRSYLQDPESVDKSWHQFFSEFGNVSTDFAVTDAPWSKKSPKIVGAKEKVETIVTAKPVASVDSGLVLRSINAIRFIEAYKNLGHTAISYDPLGIKKPQPSEELSLEYHNISQDELSKEVMINGELGIEKATLSEVISKTKQIYASKIGAEFSYMESLEEKKWIENYLENHSLNLNPEDRKKALFDVTVAEMFEDFLHKKFPGAKRFSVEGGESTIASLNSIIKNHAELGGTEAILAMAHRGRLNTLTNVMGKKYAAMFAEFAGGMAYPEEINIPGDVKYHLGFSTDKTFNDKSVHISLMPNPSHLELVNSVALGKARAKQDINLDNERSRVLAILIHGDAAFSGQGSVPESMYLSQLDGYKTGGAIHIIINNQIGFTTNPNDSRSSRYCTDVAKSISAPIFHVNGNDIDSVLFVTKLASEYRAKFKKDIVIDIVCYRKYGHNEGDEPMFTQPNMYNLVSALKAPRFSYSQLLMSEGIISESEYNSFERETQSTLEKEFEESKTYKPLKADWLDGLWSQMKPTSSKDIYNEPKTGVNVSELQDLANEISEIPEGFNLNSKIARQLSARKDTIASNENLEWGTGEALAFATLLKEGYNIRITGQDAKRGTFSHRHAVWVDQSNESTYCPLNNINASGKLEIHNSNLSELAVMGFEYGYSITDPKTLTIWEAQFGDFANGAQMMIDQYIASGEAKWLRMSGLVLLLPHGYEGQGPEHSSARLERYLQLCAADNMQVVNCSTPASFFHALRRQMHRNFRKPLVVMSPKSLLRKPLSKLSDMADGTSFSPIIEDKALNNDVIKKVIICSGKVYYDIQEKAKELGVEDVVLVRIEQLYPFPSDELSSILKKYKSAKIIWAQEEHKNMGAYTFVSPIINQILSTSTVHKEESLHYIGRGESASPSAGYMKTHLAQQKAFLDELFK